MNGPHNKNKTLDTATLAGRLALCSETAGGKRALAAAAGISEAQLFRYLNGESDIPAEKLVAVAKAGKVEPGWLLTGQAQGTAKGVDFSAGLMTDLIQLFEETLLDHTVRFTPKQRAKAVSLAYEALAREASGGELQLDKGLLLDIVEFLSPLRATDEIGSYHRLCTQLAAGEALTPPDAILFERLTTLGTVSIFEGISGQLYYDRIGYPLSTVAAQRLLASVEAACRMTGKRQLDWLDVGCGNGRHLVFLRQHANNLRLYGVDPSSIAQKLHEGLVRAGKLPENTFTQGDARQLPYADASMDVVYWRQGLYHLPWLPEHPVGLMLAMQEMARVLRPGGMVQIISASGSQQLWLPFMQQHTAESLEAAAKPHGLTLAQFERLESPSQNQGVKGKDYNPRHDDVFQAVFRKR